MQRRNTGGRELTWKQMKADPHQKNFRVDSFWKRSNDLKNISVQTFYFNWLLHIPNYCLRWLKDRKTRSTLKKKTSTSLHLKCMCEGVGMFMKNIPSAFSLSKTWQPFKVNIFLPGRAWHNPKKYFSCEFCQLSLLSWNLSHFLKNFFLLYFFPSHLHVLTDHNKIVYLSLTFPGSSLERGTLRKHLFSDRLCRIEFCEGKQRERKVSR